MSDVVKERFQKLSQEMGHLPLLELGREYVKADAALDKIKAEKAEAEARVEWLRLNIAKRQDDDQVPNFAIEMDGVTKRIRVAEELFVSAPSESGVLAKVIDIFKKIGAGALVKETIAPGTLKKHVGTILKTQVETNVVTDEYKLLLDAGLKVTVTRMSRFY